MSVCPRSEGDIEDIEDMDKLRDVAEYKEEKTQKGAMKIEVVVEQAKKPKRDRPGSASSIRNIEDIEKRQKVTVSWMLRELEMLIQSNRLYNSAILLNRCKILIRHWKYFIYRPPRSGGKPRRASRWPAWRRSRRRRRRCGPRRRPCRL